MSSANPSNTGASGAQSNDANRNRLHSPPVELPSSNAQNFFEEAKITQTEENELRRKFGKFCTKASASEGSEEEVFLTLDNFCRMLQYYECAPAQHYEAYFHAIDRNHDDKLDFQEFFLGCCAADPSTVHILNSFTGYERSQYIFDFYDKNRSSALDFNEFAQLTADCLSLPSASLEEEQAIRSQALEKARDLGAFEDSGPGQPTFQCIKFKKFYEFIQNERLRGTSRLFRFYKSIIKSRGTAHSRRAQGSSITGATAGTSHNHSTSAHVGDDGTLDEDPSSDQEDCEWHAQLLDLDAQFDPDGDEPFPTMCNGHAQAPPSYLTLLPPAPAAPLRLEPEPASAASLDARQIARRVLRAPLGADAGFLLGTGSTGAGESEAQFNLVTPAQFRCLCNAAMRLLEGEEPVLMGLRAPAKIFGAIHGQLLDLLSHFKWQQTPLEDAGDILYTTYVFLGDYADRGHHGLEVLALLLSLKVCYPQRVALLRGHHENRHINFHMGLKRECDRRLGSVEGTKVFELLNRVFENMPLAAVIGGQVLALGPGGLPPSLQRVDQLRRIRKPLILPHAATQGAAQPMDRVIIELFTPGALRPRDMGMARDVTAEQIKSFCTQNQLAAVVQSYRMPPRGFSFEFGGRLISVCSCLNYCDLPGGNDAAILCVTKEEGSSALHLRPKVITAQIGKLYSLLGKQSFGSNGGLPPRWPAQVRAATPGRTGGPNATARGGADGEIGDASGLVLMDHGITPDSGASVGLFPAFGPGRMPSALQQRVAGGDMSIGGADSPRFQAQGLGSAARAQVFTAAAGGAEDSTHLGQGAAGRPGVRGSLGVGPRRSSSSAGPSLVSSVNAGASAGGAGTTLPVAPRLPLTGVGTSVAGGDSSSSAGAGAHRRSGRSPSSDAAGPGLGSAATGASAGGAAGMGSVTPTGGGRESRAAAGAAAAAAAAVTSNGKGPGTKNSSRPHSAAPSIKTSVGGAGNGASGRPRQVTGHHRGDSGNSGAGSPHQSPEEGMGLQQAVHEQRAFSPPADPQALGRLLKETSKLTFSAMPPSPAPFLQAPRGPPEQQPLLLHLCRIWVEAGLGEKEWVQALQMFETELCDQPRAASKGAGRSPTAGASAAGGGSTAGESEAVDLGWTLETFSMWLLKRGRRLRECSQWFRAFDFDQDDMIGTADFLQGLVAAAAPRAPEPSSTGGLCSALALFRLLNLERKQSLDVQDLESILVDAQVSISGFSLPLPQIAQRATDFEFFRASLLPRLQGASAFRLRVFGSQPPEA